MVNIPQAQVPVVLLGTTTPTANRDVSPEGRRARGDDRREVHLRRREPFHCDDLSEVDAVVRAIVRRWTSAPTSGPFPREDLCRDEHVRRSVWSCSVTGSISGSASTSGRAP